MYCLVGPVVKVSALRVTDSGSIPAFVCGFYWVCNNHHNMRTLSPLTDVTSGSFRKFAMTADF